MSDRTEAVIHQLGDQINDLQAASIRKLSDLTRHGYAFVNITVRVDGRTLTLQGDWLANLLNPRGPSGDTQELPCPDCGRLVAREGHATSCPSLPRYRLPNWGQPSPGP